VSRKQSRPLVTVIDRLIMKDLFRTIFSVLMVLVIIIVSRHFIKILQMAVDGLISTEAVVKILGLRMLILSADFMVPAVFVAVLMVLGRMYRDQEMSALASAGMGVGGLYVSVFKTMIPILVLAVNMAFFVSPWASNQVDTLLHQEKQGAGIRGIAAGKFSEYSQGNLIFYTEKISANHKMHDVFVQDRRDEQVGIITSATAELRETPNGLYIVFLQGQRVQGEVGELDYAFEEFSEYAMRIEAASGDLVMSQYGLPSGDLFSSPDLKDLRELFRRSAIPMGIIFLTIMAVPLAQVSPRGGVYGNMLTAFLIFFSFSNFEKVSTSWMLKGEIPVWLGFSAVYLLSSLIIIGLLLRLYGIRWFVLNLRAKFA